MKRRTALGLGLAGVLLGISGCGTMTPVGGSTYSYRVGNETKYNTVGIKQNDGSYLYEFSRDSEFQRRIKNALRKSLSRGRLSFRPDGTIRDVRYFRKFPDGSATIKYYQDE